MHQAMLNGYMEHLQQVRMTLFRALQRMLYGMVEFFAHALIVAPDFLQRGPITRGVDRQSAANRINSESKELIEERVEGAQTERATGKEVPVKSFQVAYIKNDAVSLGDRSVVQSLLANHLEKLIGSRASFEEASMKIVTDADSSGGECSHSVYPFF